MKKEKIVFVGQTPSKWTGNGNMIQTCLDQVNRDKYEVFALLYGEPDIAGLRKPFEDLYHPGCPFFYLREEGTDWGSTQLLDFLQIYEIDQLIFVGIDIWRYAKILPEIRKLASKNKFLWKVLAPYDLGHLREDWLTWFTYPDQVYIYSEFGYNLLKDELPNCYYYRPQPRYLSLLKPPSPDEKEQLRKALFADATEDTIIVGFVGNNQLRKNILRMMKGMSTVLNQNKDIIFYLHMDKVNGIFDIELLSSDLGFPKKAIRHNGNSRRLFPEELVSVCKTFDLFLLPSLQEGLSWTVIEMSLLGIPCAISRSTSHFDYFHCETLNRLSIPLTDTAFLPLPNGRGVSYIPVDASSPLDIATFVESFINIKREANGSEKIKKMSEDVLNFAKEWVSGCFDISIILENKETQNIAVQLQSKIGEII